MDKLFEELFDDLDEAMDELRIDESGDFSQFKTDFLELFDSSSTMSGSKKWHVNHNYFQEELDDNADDDYVLNGFGSLDDDE
ncbi:MAG: hypothetical protein IKB71_01080 [Lentisphaeria bacterium]|nr:hypothetical protein [Lentisphaeria bacterium]